MKYLWLTMLLISLMIQNGQERRLVVRKEVISGAVSAPNSDKCETTATTIFELRARRQNDERDWSRTTQVAQAPVLWVLLFSSLFSSFFLSFPLIRFLKSIFFVILCLNFCPLRMRTQWNSLIEPAYLMVSTVAQIWVHFAREAIHHTYICHWWRRLNDIMTSLDFPYHSQTSQYFWLSSVLKRCVYKTFE